MDMIYIYIHFFFKVGFSVLRQIWISIGGNRVGALRC